MLGSAEAQAELTEWRDSQRRGVGGGGWGYCHPPRLSGPADCRPPSLLGACAGTGFLPHPVFPSVLVPPSPSQRLLSVPQWLWVREVPPRQKLFFGEGEVGPSAEATAGRCRRSPRLKRQQGTGRAGAPPVAGWGGGTHTGVTGDLFQLVAV